MPDRFVTVELGAGLIEHPEKNAAVQWPLPIDHRLERLVEVAASVGERTTRKELAAAIVLDSTEDGEQLSALLRRYRLATAGDALPWHRDERVVELPLHKPGPRTRRNL